MTNVQQVESTQTKKRPQKQQTKKRTRKRGDARKQPDEGRQPDEINDDAVAEGKRIVAQEEKNDWRLGELADRVEPRYGDKTLTKLAKAIGGIAACTLERRRSVYRAWKEIPAAPPKSFAVAQELQAHPDRAQIIENKPDITTREARKQMREWKEQRDQADPNFAKEKMKKLFTDLLLRASKAVADENMITNLNQEERRNLRKAIIQPGLLAELREAARAWTAVAGLSPALSQ